jgi:hypothetical protein
MGDTMTHTFWVQIYMPGPEQSNARTANRRCTRSSLRRTSRLENVMRRADLREVLIFIFLPQGLLCGDRIGKDVWTGIWRKATYYVQNIVAP